MAARSGGTREGKRQRRDAALRGSRAGGCAEVVEEENTGRDPRDGSLFSGAGEAAGNHVSGKPSVSGPRPAGDPCRESSELQELGGRCRKVGSQTLNGRKVEK